MHTPTFTTGNHNVMEYQNNQSIKKIKKGLLIIMIIITNNN